MCLFLQVKNNNKFWVLSFTEWVSKVFQNLINKKPFSSSFITPINKLKAVSRKNLIQVATIFHHSPFRVTFFDMTSLENHPTSFNFTWMLSNKVPGVINSDAETSQNDNKMGHSHSTLHNYSFFRRFLFGWKNNNDNHKSLFLTI